MWQTSGVYNVELGEISAKSHLNDRILSLKSKKTLYNVEPDKLSFQNTKLSQAKNYDMHFWIKQQGDSSMLDT